MNRNKMSRNSNVTWTNAGRLVESAEHVTEKLLCGLVGLLFLRALLLYHDSFVQLFPGIAA